ncbi:Peptidase family M48 [Andreprevotia lacus DSM 23236]|uniref:Peptidase family M48 n=1 Tax=Andreprevotia lacus DSM 23236 TaxID=1121001 RepID=A0A1W1XD58_9NEIS|nr:M48 family metalloprotease [Andreprevotia lacus]SMC21421.1 Peptidase family M48 [Andreprevotia lacus DSM 23236]
MSNAARSPDHDDARAEPRARMLGWLLLGDVAVYGVIVLLFSLPLLAGWLGGMLWFWVLVFTVSWPGVAYVRLLLQARRAEPDTQEADELLVDPASVPVLAGVLREIEQGLGMRHGTQIALDGRMNASIRLVQQGRRQRRRLTIGLPVLLALDEPCCRAMLLHECAHLAREHGRWSQWFHVRLQWWRRLADIHRQNHAMFTVPLRLFLRWYVPRLWLRRLAFSRVCERMADQWAVQQGGAAAGRLHLAMAVQDRTLSNYWQTLYAGAGRQGIAAVTPYQMLLSVPQHALPVDQAQARAWLDAALAEPAAEGDTHPVLLERLQMAGVHPGQLPADWPWQWPARPAATVWLGKALPALAARLDEHWQQAAEPYWQQAADAAGARTAEYHATRRRQQIQRLNADDWFVLAVYQRGQGAAEWVDALRQGLALDARHAGLNRLLAEQTAKRGDWAAASRRWQIVLADPEAERETPLCELLACALRLTDTALATWCRSELAALYVYAESPELYPHGLGQAELAKVRNDLDLLLRSANAVWLFRQSEDAAAPEWLLLIKAWDDWLLRTVANATGQIEATRAACNRLLPEVLGKTHLKLAVDYLLPGDVRLAACVDAAKL